MSDLKLGPPLGRMGGGGAGIAPAAPIPLTTGWTTLGEVRVSAPVRAIIYATDPQGASSAAWGSPYPRIRWRQISTGDTHEHEFSRSIGAEDFMVSLGPGRWAAEISGMSTADRTHITYVVTAAAVPIGDDSH